MPIDADTATSHVNWYVSELLKQLKPLPAKSLLTFYALAKSGEQPHEGELRFDDGYSIDLVNSSLLRGENKAFINALRDELDQHPDVRFGMSNCTQWGDDVPGYDEETEFFKLSILRRALRKLEKLVIEEPQPEPPIPASVVRANLHAHFHDLLVAAGWDYEQIDTELTVLADVDLDTSNDVDHNLINYRIKDAKSKFICYCEEEYVEAAQLDNEGDPSDVYCGNIDLSEVVGMDLKSFVVAPQVSQVS